VRVSRRRSERRVGTYDLIFLGSPLNHFGSCGGVGAVNVVRILSCGTSGEKLTFVLLFWRDEACVSGTGGDGS
jgi:hypothetical protein